MQARTKGPCGTALPWSSRLYASTSSAPSTTSGASSGETTITPTTPIPTAPASPTAAITISGVRRSAVASGRPFSSSSACALTPTARKNAPSAAPNRSACTAVPRRRSARRSSDAIPCRAMKERDEVTPSAGRQGVKRRAVRLLRSTVATPHPPHHQSAPKLRTLLGGRPGSRRRPEPEQVGLDRVRSRCRTKEAPTSTQAGETSHPSSGEPKSGVHPPQRAQSGAARERRTRPSQSGPRVLPRGHSSSSPHGRRHSAIDT